MQNEPSSENIIPRISVTQTSTINENVELKWTENIFGRIVAVCIVCI
jgi:hypothetical protein